MLPADAAALADLAVPSHILERYGAAMDIVGRLSRRSTCFTKNYSRYIKVTDGASVTTANTTATAPIVTYLLSVP